MTALDVLELPRLDHNEFLNYLPHLTLEEQLMTQIKLNGSWDFLFKGSFKRQSQICSLTCLACKESVEFTKFNVHLKSSSHVQALKKVKQFYHPYYTYNKECGNISDQHRTAISKSKEIAQYIREHGVNSNIIPCNEGLVKRILTKNVSEPEDLLVDVKLPLTELLNIEFSTEKGKWIRMITVNKTANTKFYCALCSKFCFGIITVDNHLKGLAHKRAQLACLGVRSSHYKYLNKNCIYGHGETFSFNLKKTATESFKDQSLSKSHSNSELINAECPEKNQEIKENNLTGKNSASMLEHNTKPALCPLIANKVKLIKEELQMKDKNVEGLIGVEYVVKIMKTTTDKYPIYECSLCEIILNENRMQGHITGYNHRLKYCELHYPNTIDKFKNMIGHVKYIDYFNAMSHILSKLASAIELHHGRSTPYVVLSSTFSKMRTELIAHIYSYPNACQQYGPSFTHVISCEEIKKIISKRIEYVAHNNNYARFAENPERKFYLNQKCHDPNKRNGESFDIRKRKRSPSPITSKTYAKEFSRSRSPKKIKSSLPHLANKSTVPSIYRDEITVATCEIERIYKEYRKNPESHPLYDEEWNAFWRRRKEQLISQGIDHRSYNYQPEWVKYFRCRLEELFEKEIKDSKMEVLDRLSEHNSSKSLQSVKDFHPKPNKASGIHYQKSSLNVISECAQRDYFSENNMTDGKPTVIHVLRLLTALEDYLGSLGIKIMDLLSKALMIEKNCSNNYELEQQILSFDNCTLLETAVEKLKGILFAGLLDKTKLQGFNRVIKFTTDLLQYADKMGWRSLQKPIANKTNTPTLQKLTEAVQNTGTDTFPANQKSLSDTLMDLLYMQENYTQGIGQYCLETHERDGYWRNFENNCPYLLTTPSYFERTFKDGDKPDMMNDQNCGNVAFTTNIPRYSYKTMGGVKSFLPK